MMLFIYSLLIRNYKIVRFYACVIGLTVLITFVKRSVSVFVPAVGAIL
jgi:hypothetical protein